MTAPSGSALPAGLFQVTFSDPNGPIELTGGVEYVAFITRQGAGDPLGPVFSAEFEDKMGDPDGTFVWNRDGNPFGGLWETQNADLSFTADFSPGTASVAPEPVSGALLATGLLGIGFVARRRKRERTEPES